MQILHLYQIFIYTPDPLTRSRSAKILCLWKNDATTFCLINILCSKYFVKEFSLYPLLSSLWVTTRVTSTETTAIIGVRYIYPASNVLKNFFPLIGRSNVKHYRTLFGKDSLHKYIASNIVVNEKTVISNPVQGTFQKKIRVSTLKTHCWCFRLSRSLWTGLWSSGEHATLPRRFFGDFIYFFDPLFFLIFFLGLIHSERKKCIRRKE